MKKLIILPILLLSIMCMSINRHTISSVDAMAIRPNNTTSICVIEKDTKKVFYEENKDIQRANASTTKILTCITCIQNLTNLDEVITVDDKAIGVEGTSIYLRKGEQISVRDLLYGLMLRSGNDASVALAIHTACSVENFAKMMNDLSKKCGATNSNFVNPHGLDDPNHYTTSYDLALITAYALNNPIFAEIVKTKQHTIPATNVSDVRYLSNKNKLLRRLDGCCGVKTGFTTKAGRCLVSACERDDMTLVCVVLNCGPMFEVSENLLNKGFNEYKNVCVVKKDTPIYNEYVVDDKIGRLELYTDESFCMPIKIGEEKDIKVIYKLDNLSENIEENSVVGEISIFYKNVLQKTLKLYTINKIDVLDDLDYLKSIKLQWEEGYENK